MRVNRNATERVDLNGDLLVLAKRLNQQRFKKMVTALRKQGRSDREMVDAMVRSPELVRAVGSLR
jgi:hypothetical protein